MRGGGIVRCICTDPPYGVAYVENKEHFKRKDGGVQISVAKKIQNDELQTDEQYALFTKQYLDAIVPHLDSYNVCYIFNADTMICALRNGMKQAGFYYSQMIIWIKNQVVIGRKDYLPQHELIAYGWHGRHKMERSKAKSVLFHAKPSRSKLHPTMKPIGLLRKLILNSTKIGETIYDPFCGSGSTLMACEQLKRKCIAIELEPEYCQIIINRWQKLTDKIAEKIS